MDLEKKGEQDLEKKGKKKAHSSQKSVGIQMKGPVLKTYNQLIYFSVLLKMLLLNQTVFLNQAFGAVLKS